jgi:hypothetical protein
MSQYIKKIICFEKNYKVINYWMEGVVDYSKNINFVTLSGLSARHHLGFYNNNTPSGFNQEIKINYMVNNFIRNGSFLLVEKIVIISQSRRDEIIIA